MPSSGYTAISFVANEQPTTAKWNLIGSNDASFNTGAGFNDSIILNRHIADNSISLKKANADVAFFAHMASGTNNTSNGSNKVPLNGEVYDQGNNFDSTTNFRFVAPANGIYNFSGCVRTGNSSAIRLIALLYKNGVVWTEGVSQAADTFTSSNVAADIKLAASDYIELWITSNGVNGMTNTTGTDYVTYMSGHLIGEY